MKHVYRLAAVFLAVAAFSGFALAQSPDVVLTTDGGLSVTHPADWYDDFSGGMKINLRGDDGWLMTVYAGADADYGFSGDEYLPPANVIENLTAFMKMAAAATAVGEPELAEVGIIAGVRQSYLLESGGLFEAFAYTLPDGMSVLAMVGNDSAGKALTPAIRETFHAVLSSATFEAPEIIETETPDEETIYVPEGAVLIDSLEAGELRFATGVETTYPEGWRIYSESAYIESSVVLIYGASIMNYDAMVTINVQDSIDMTADFFRQHMMSTTAMMYNGQDTFDPERDIITEVLPDGRVLEYLLLPEDDSIIGNTYVITLDSRYWVWAMFVNANPDGAEARAAEVKAIVENMVLNLSEETAEYDGHRFTIVNATCETVITSGDVNENVPYAAFNCPAGCADVGYSIWGSDIYTLDSTVCAAAIHANAITNEAGGFVLASWVAGQESYAATERNGISTMDYGAWGDSFSVVPLPDAE